MALDKKPHDLILEGSVLPREDLVKWSPKHGNGPPAAADCSRMGGSVDPLGKPTDDHDAAPGQETGDPRPLRQNAGIASDMEWALPGAHVDISGQLRGRRTS